MISGNFLLGLLVGAVRAPVLFVVAVAWYARRRVKEQAYRPPWVPSDDPVSLDWTVQALDGKEVILAELFAGQVGLLNFWATWCPPCVGEAGSLDRLYERFKGRVAFACLSQEPTARVRGFQERSGYRFPMYHLSGEAPADFRTEGIPSTFILSRDRRVVLRHVGGADWGHESVVRFLEHLLAEGGSADTKSTFGGME